jgi:methylated-DNA-protein-cysteine methyltransferase-like protein
VGEPGFEPAVRRVIESIEAGEVLTYGEVAAEAGFPGAARAVGNLLRSSEGLPWWRVVAGSGRLTPHAGSDHAALLRAEGHEIVVDSSGRSRLR